MIAVDNLSFALMSSALATTILRKLLCDQYAALFPKILVIASHKLMQMHDVFIESRELDEK